jgi:hypothetical protein
MFNTVGKRLLYIVRECDTRPVELISCFLITLWGTLVIIPGISLGGISFRILSVLLPETIWALIAIVIGLLAAYGLLLNGYIFRYWMLFVKAIFWACLAAGTILGNIMAPAWLFYLVLALSSGWAFLRLRDDSDDWER